MLTLQEILDDFAQYADLDACGVSVNTQNAAGETPVHWMAALGDDAAIRLLAQAGADLSAQDHQGNTALHLAVTGAHDSAVAVLIAEGADVTLHNALNQTPEDFARAFQYTRLADLFTKR